MIRLLVVTSLGTIACGSAAPSSPLLPSSVDCAKQLVRRDMEEFDRGLPPAKP